MHKFMEIYSQPSLFEHEYEWSNIVHLLFYFNISTYQYILFCKLL
jgi:hypothetical protein